MKINSYIKIVSVCSLVWPAFSYASLETKYASLLDISQSQALESEPMALGPVLPGQGSLKNYLKTASVRFITDGKNGNNHFNGSSEQEFSPGDLCYNAGYRQQSCPAGYIKGEVCPDDSSYVKECIDPASWCKDNGYAVSKCTLPKYPAEVCPHNGAYYKTCETDNIRACKEAGYSLACEAGKVGDAGQACPYNESYKKCVCNPCEGFDYTAEQASAQGYTPGEVCNSCGTMKYKRSANACDGFKECTNGGTAGADVCYAGNLKKFSECDDGCDPEFNTYPADCTGDYTVDSSRGFCNGKYIGCVRAAKVLYGDGSVGMVSELYANKDKKPIGIVVDETNRLAVALTNIVKDGSWEDNQVRFASGINPDVDMQRGIDYNICKGASGRVNTNILLNMAGTTVMQAPFEAAELVNAYEPDACSASVCQAGKWFLPVVDEWKKLKDEKEAILNLLSKLHGYIDGNLWTKAIEDIKGKYNSGFYTVTPVWLAVDNIGFYNGQWNYNASTSYTIGSGVTDDWADLNSVRPFLLY